MEGKDFCFYEFEDFRLDPRRRSLSKNGEKVPLSARNFDLLLFMVENSGKILEHDELLDKVWAGTFVEQATLKKGISALRQILVEKPETEFIKTIPRRGYSFVSPVRVVPDNPENVYVRETESEIIIEEFEETDETSGQSEKVIELPAATTENQSAIKSKKTNLYRTAMFSVVALGVIALAFFGIKSYFSKTVRAQFSVETVRVNRITNTGKILDTTISPDGTYILFPSAEKDGVSLWVRQLSSNTTNRLTPPINGSFWGFGFAPDNSYIYYIFNNRAEPQKSGLYKIPLLGDEPQRIEENISSFVVSPDGKKIVLVRINDKTNIFLTDMNGADKREVTALPSEQSLQGISWTPDGTALLVTVRKTIGDKRFSAVLEISPETGKETEIIPPTDKIIFGAVWLPDKSAMIFTMREPNGDIRQIWQYFPASQEWRRVTNDDNSYKYAQVTRDGKTIVSSQESRLAAIWVADGLKIDKTNVENKSLLNTAGNFKQITDGVNNFDRLGWLDDNRLIYSATEERKEMVFTVNADGTKPRSLTDGEDGIWLFPSIAGNGRDICFLSLRSGIKQAWRVDGEGKGLTKITQTNSHVFTARILRDNSTVLYTSQQNKDTFLFKQTADGQITQLTEAPTAIFAVSKDEKLLAVEILNKNSGKFYVELHSLEDGKVIKTFDFVPVRQMNFTPDGKNIAYDAKQGDRTQIMIQPLEGGDAFALTDFQTDEIFDFDWSPDSNRLAVIRGKSLNDAVIIKADNP